MNLSWFWTVFIFTITMMTMLLDVTNAEEDKIVGLEEFLTDLDPNTSDIILELLEAQQLSTNKSNRMMRRIMRKLSPEALEQLFQIYKTTRNQ